MSSIENPQKKDGNDPGSRLENFSLPLENMKKVLMEKERTNSAIDNRLKFINDLIAEIDRIKNEEIEILPDEVLRKKDLLASLIEEMKDLARKIPELNSDIEALKMLYEVFQVMLIKTSRESEN